MVVFVSGFGCVILGGGVVHLYHVVIVAKQYWQRWIWGQYQWCWLRWQYWLHNSEISLILIVGVFGGITDGVLDGSAYGIVNCHD